MHLPLHLFDKYRAQSLWGKCTVSLGVHQVAWDSRSTGATVLQLSTN